MAIVLGVGLVAGILAGMLGIGGGAILIPGMVLLMGTDQHTAQGVSLAVIALTALVGAITHYRQQNLQLRVALWLAPAAVVFAFIGGMVADKIEASILRQIFGVVVIILGASMVVGGWPLWRR